MTGGWLVALRLMNEIKSETSRPPWGGGGGGGGGVLNFDVALKIVFLKTDYSVFTSTHVKHHFCDILTFGSTILEGKYQCIAKEILLATAMSCRDSPFSSH